jgi:hypothetical protein
MRFVIHGSGVPWALILEQIMVECFKASSPLPKISELDAHRPFTLNTTPKIHKYMSVIIVRHLHIFNEFQWIGKWLSKSEIIEWFRNSNLRKLTNNLERENLRQIDDISNSKIGLKLLELYPEAKKAKNIFSFQKYEMYTI